MIFTSVNCVFLLETGLVLGVGDERQRNMEETDAWREVMDYADFQEGLSKRVENQLPDFAPSSYYPDTSKQTQISYYPETFMSVDTSGREGFGNRRRLQHPIVIQEEEGRRGTREWQRGHQAQLVGLGMDSDFLERFLGMFEEYIKVFRRSHLLAFPFSLIKC